MFKKFKKCIAFLLVMCLFIQSTNCFVFAEENTSTQIQTSQTVSLKTQDGRNFAIPAGLYFIPGIGEVLIEATGAIIVAGVAIEVGSWIYNTIVDWFSSGNAFSKSADDAVDNLDDNGKTHIMQEKHNWNKLDKDPQGPKWETVAVIIKKTLKSGDETWQNNNVYIRTLTYHGEKVVVRFVKNTAGLVWKIGTAWVE